MLLELQMEALEWLHWLRDLHLSGFFEKWREIYAAELDTIFQLNYHYGTEVLSSPQ